jgi:hypothetical protein
MKERPRLQDELKEKIKDAVAQSTNVAAAVNVGGKSKRTSVSSRQRVVHRDGVTTTTTETREERTTDTEGR